MHFSKAIPLALIAVLPLALGSPTLNTRQNGVTCQTSNGSPLTNDVTDVINQLNGQGGSCPQTNGDASGEKPRLLLAVPLSPPKYQKKKEKY